MTRRRLTATALCALASIQLVVFCVGGRLEQRVEEVGALLSRVLPRASVSEKPWEPTASSDVAMSAMVSLPDADPPGLARSESTRNSSGKKAVRPTPAPRDIRVSASTVLGWVRAGVRPSAVSVPAAKNRPSGIRLTDVRRLGIGVHEGDVMTHVEGRAVGSVGDVVGLVLAARGRRQATVVARLYREGRGYSVTVEMPYFDPPRKREMRPVVASNL